MSGAAMHAKYEERQPIDASAHGKTQICFQNALEEVRLQDGEHGSNEDGNNWPK